MAETPIKIQMLTSGVLYQHYFEHIHCFAVTDSTRETVDATYDKITQLDRHYAEKGWHIQYLYVVDNVTITPYMALKLQKSVALMPKNLTESIAVVADSFLSDVLNRLIVPILNLEIETETRFFYTDAEAFEWFEKRREEIGF